MSKQHVLLIFNKFSRVYLGMTAYVGEKGDPNMNNENTTENSPIILKRVLMDPETEVWEGTYDDGRIIPISKKKPVITEAVLDAAAKNKIQRKFKYYHQLNIMMTVMDKIIAKLDIPEEELEEYNLMKEYISSIRENNERYKDSYMKNENFDYYDKSAMMDRINQELEGGLHEVVGRPEFKVDSPWTSEDG